MQVSSIAEAAVNLRIATRKACMTGAGKGMKCTLSLETKLLFLLNEKPLTPNTITDILQLQKSNLAALAKNLESDGLIERHKLLARRETSYRITDKGQATLKDRLDEIEAVFKKFLDDEKEYAAAVETLEEATRLLGFV